MQGPRNQRELHSNRQDNLRDGEDFYENEQGRQRVKLSDDYEHIQRPELMHTQKYITDRIKFMFDPPYPIQLRYMNHILQCLDNQDNCFAQSPTGTGKTLCLLNSVFSWLTSLKAKNPTRYQKLHQKSFSRVRVIYLSRTHTQLEQVKKQLEKTCYRPNMVVFGGRKKMCCNSNVNNPQIGEQQIYKTCTEYAKNKRALAKIRKMTEQQKVKKKITPQYEQQLELKSCPYFQEWEQRKQKGMEIFMKHFQNKPIALNDEIQTCKQQGTCPYYYPASVKYEADLILMPYTYILNKNIFKRFGGIVKNSILIFDEGHNIAECAREGLTVTLMHSEFVNLEKQLQYYLKKCQKGFDDDDHHPNDENGGSDEEKEQQQSKKKDKPRIVLQIQSEEKKEKNSLNKDKDRKDKKPQDSSGKKKEDQRKEEEKKRQVKRLQQLIVSCKQKIVEMGQKFAKFQQQEVQNENGSKQYGIERGEDGQGISKKIVEILFGLKAHQITGIQIDQCVDKMATIALNLASIFDLITFLSKKKSFPFTFSKFGEKMQQISEIIQSAERLFDYGLFFEWKDIENENKKNQPKLLVKLYCYNPKLMFDLITKANPYSIIVTSGTLSPYDTWQIQTGLQFKGLENNSQHVIKASQCVTRFFPSYGKDYNAYYSVTKNKGSVPNLQTSCTRAMHIISEICKKTPGGILVILSSEAWRKQITKIYKNYNIKQKTFFEQKGDPDFKDLDKFKQKFKSFCKTKQGAILFAICRGQVTEGIDFNDDLCRAVVVVGYPCPDLKNPYLIGRMNYIDRLKIPSFDGQAWMEKEIMRAVNQGIGRVIRHIDDYGMIFLLDCRYKFPGNLSKIAKWALRNPESKSIKDFSEIENICEKFFKQNKQNYDKK